MSVTDSSMVGRWLILLALWGLCEAGPRYAFFRSRDQYKGRRVFGGQVARVGAWPAACALLDRVLSARCSCAVLAPRWAVTAAHCVTSVVAYVQYNGDSNSDIVAVRLLYAHPKFKVEEKDLGIGLDVVTLHHDIGLVRTRADMSLPDHQFFPLPTASMDTVAAMSLYDTDFLIGREIDVLGFGMTDKSPSGEHLREVQLRLVSCDRPDWLNCKCAMGTAAGVCAGDSGGPVLYNGTQIGVTSMGPVECSETTPAPAMSVFTELRPYAELVDATMRDLDTALRMRVVPSAAPRHVARAVCAATLLLCRYAVDANDSLCVYGKPTDPNHLKQVSAAVSWTRWPTFLDTPITNNKTGACNSGSLLHIVWPELLRSSRSRESGYIVGGGRYSYECQYSGTSLAPTVQRRTKSCNNFIHNNVAGDRRGRGKGRERGAAGGKLGLS